MAQKITIFGLSLAASKFYLHQSIHIKLSTHFGSLLQRQDMPFCLSQCFVQPMPNLPPLFVAFVANVAWFLLVGQGNEREDSWITSSNHIPSFPGKTTDDEIFNLL